MAAVRLSEVQFSYPGERAFGMQIETLEIPAGECAAIVGPSGSGKTTLLGLVAGILEPQAGTVLVGDAWLNRMNEAARRRFRIHRVGQVFQAFELLEYLTVTDNLLLAGHIGSSVDKQTRERASELLASVGLQDKAGAHPAELSHGERQRVAVCRAMLNQPELLLADEPTGNLDAANKQNVVDLLIRQANEHGSTLLMVTHDRSLLGSFERVIDFGELTGTAT
jgi:ABC-type lipoprotein export system ATPase subunit